MAASPVTLEWWPAALVRGERQAEILDLWAAVWPNATRAATRELLARHTRRDGFRFVAAHTGMGLAGLAYGYTGARGQYWRDAVARQLTPAQRRRWLPRGFFELAELMVHPEQRRRGIGGLVHDELLRDLGAPLAALSTQVSNAAATALYESRGWVTVLPSMQFAPGEEPYRIMGLDLPAE